MWIREVPDYELDHNSIQVRICYRCGALILADVWDMHYNWHYNNIVVKGYGGHSGEGV